MRAIRMVLITILLLATPYSGWAFLLSFGSAGAMTGDQKAYITQLVDAFRLDHSDVEVRLRESMSYVKPIIETLMSDVGVETPDLAVVGLVEWPVLYKKGMLRPFTATIAEPELQNVWRSLRPDLIQQHYGAGIDFKHFALPFNRAIPALFVNTKLLPLGASKKSITWTELKSLLASKGQRLAVATDDWISEGIFLNSRQATSLKGSRVYLSDPETLRTVQLIKGLVSDGRVVLVPSQHQGYLDFIEGRVAAALISISTYKSIAARVSFPFRIIMPPKVSASLTVLGGGDLVLPGKPGTQLDPKKKRDIAKFLKWIYFERGALMWPQLTGFLPLTKTALAKVKYDRDADVFRNTGRWRIGSFYELDEYCNIIPLRAGIEKAFKESLANDDPSLVLRQAETFLTSQYAKPCP